MTELDFLAPLGSVGVILGILFILNRMGVLNFKKNDDELAAKVAEMVVTNHMHNFKTEIREELKEINRRLNAIEEDIAYWKGRFNAKS